MDHGADPNIADDRGVLALHYACRVPPFEITDEHAQHCVSMLLGYERLDPNLPDDTGSSALMVAAEIGRVQVVRRALEPSL